MIILGDWKLNGVGRNVRWVFSYFQLHFKIVHKFVLAIPLDMGFWMRVQWSAWQEYGTMCRSKSGVELHIPIHISIYYIYIYTNVVYYLLLRNASRIIPRGNRLHLQLYTDGCSEKRESQVKYIEHVQAIGKVTRVGCIVIKKFLYLKVSLNAPKRGFCFHQNKFTIALWF